jgi:hypothetical protein
METISRIADILSIFGAAFALLAWWQARRIRQELKRETARLNNKVTIKLVYGGHEIELPVELQRGELTRAELLGRLGMIPMKNKGSRFSLAYTNTPDFLREINRIKNADGIGVLIIPCEKDEFEQFDVKK